MGGEGWCTIKDLQVHMGGEGWCTIKDLQAPFPVLKTGHVDHLLVYTYVLIF